MNFVDIDLPSAEVSEFRPFVLWLHTCKTGSWEVVSEVTGFKIGMDLESMAKC
jgi:hypothetical protein